MSREGNTRTKFNSIMEVFSQLKLSYVPKSSGWDFSFDEQLSQDSYTSKYGINGEIIQETIGLENFIKALNNTFLQPDIRPNSIKGLASLINSFVWGNTEEGEDVWIELYDKCEEEDN